MVQQDISGVSMKAIPMQSVPVAVDRPGFIQDDPVEMAVQIQAVLPGYLAHPADGDKKDTLLVQDSRQLKPTRRLVVLVPPGEIDEPALARRVWQLAIDSCLGVLYLALCPDDLQVSHQRLRLADLAAVTSGRAVRAHAIVSEEKNWRLALAKVLAPGDVLVCLASHTITRYLAWRAPLGEQLAETAGVPVFMLDGFKIGQSPNQKQALKGLLAWIACVALLVGFFGIQVGIVRSTDQLLSSILLCLSVLVELYLLWKINDWIG